MKASNTQIQMRKGILECCILHIISREEVYASDMMEELKEANLIIVEGTLYPLLNRLKHARLVYYRWVESEHGPPRKYYSITPLGLDFLHELSNTWHQLNQSVNAILSKTSKAAPDAEGFPMS
jgi:PadR family transcriptional regulator, regulatory protein PadR